MSSNVLDPKFFDELKQKNDIKGGITMWTIWAVYAGQVKNPLNENEMEDENEQEI